MKKLKCSSCGAPLKIEDNKEYAICDHCGTKYKLNEDININIKLGDEDTSNIFSKMSLVMIIPIIIFVIALIIIIAFAVTNSKNASNKNKIDNNNNEIKETIKEQEEEAKKQVFNFQFTNDNGTKDAFFLKSTFDDIVESNKKYDRKVALVFDGKETTDENEIISIKQSLSGEYEVSFDYDKDGYINKIIVNKI